MKRLLLSFYIVGSMHVYGMGADFDEKYAYLKKVEKTIYSDLLHGMKIESTKGHWETIKFIAHHYVSSRCRQETRRRAYQFLGKSCVALGVLTHDPIERRVLFEMGQRAFDSERGLVRQKKKQFTDLSNYPLPGTILSE